MSSAGRDADPGPATCRQEESGDDERRGDGETFSLILEPGSAKPVAVIGRLVAARTGMHPADATTRVRYGGGLLAENLSREEAEALELELRNVEVRTRRIETAGWIAAPAGHGACALEFLEDTLLARLQLGESLVVPRDDVLGIQLYGLLRDHEDDGEDEDDFLSRRGARSRKARRARKRKSASVNRDLSFAAEAFAGAGATSVLSPRGRLLLGNMKERDAESMELHLTLYCLDPTGPVRFEREKLDFSCLGEDKQEHSLDNFLTLLEKLVAFLPETTWNLRTAEEFLENLDPQAILYFKEEEAENFDRWMYQLVPLGGDGDGESDRAATTGAADGEAEAEADPGAQADRGARTMEDEAP